MKKYFTPAYAMAELVNNELNILGISFELIEGDNSVIINQDAENLFN